jgi:hypothetical protein
MSPPRKKPSAVREPIQVYLDRGERADLDRLARELGISRAQVLRQGIAELKRRRPKDVYALIEEWLAEPHDPNDVRSDADSIDEKLAQVRDEKAAEFLRKYPPS